MSPVRAASSVGYECGRSTVRRCDLPKPNTGRPGRHAQWLGASAQSAVVSAVSIETPARSAAPPHRPLAPVARRFVLPASALATPTSSVACPVLCPARPACHCVRTARSVARYAMPIVCHASLSVAQCSRPPGHAGSPRRCVVLRPTRRAVHADTSFDRSVHLPERTTRSIEHPDLSMSSDARSGGHQHRPRAYRTMPFDDPAAPSAMPTRPPRHA